MTKGNEALDDIALLVLLTTGKDRAWLDSLTGGSSLDLIYKILEVNFDFFILKFQRNSIALANRLSSLGQTTQPNSLPTDTVGATSDPTPSSK